MPQARAAASLEPSANTRRPKTVLRKTTAITMANRIASHTPGATSSQEGEGNVTARLLTQVSGTLTVCWPASHLADPRATPNMPSVAMNGTTRSPVIDNPFTNPTIPPVQTPAKTAIVEDHP